MATSGQLTATVTFDDDSTEDVTGAATWTSSNEAAATVAAGLVTAKSDAADGATTTVTASYLGETATCAVTVHKVPASLALDPTNLALTTS